MSDEQTAPRASAKQRRARHANAQASYMERKRAEGKEWLATWVPGDAKDAFKELARQSNEDEHSPSGEYIAAVEQAVNEEAPDWAKANLTLFNVWLISAHNVQIDLGNPGGKKEKKEKKDKKEKKKKKDKKK